MVGMDGAGDGWNAHSLSQAECLIIVKSELNQHAVIRSSCNNIERKPVRVKKKNWGRNYRTSV